MHLTTPLDAQPDPQLAEAKNPLIAKVVNRLRDTYDFDYLGNLDDPLDELVYIVLSSRTRFDVFRRTFANLKAEFPSWEDVSVARVGTIEQILAPSGLSRKKARWLKDTLAEIREREGEMSLARLSLLSDVEAEAYLTSLPGVGLKTARCVLMYSLHRQVLPVDANVWRLLERLEVVPPDVHYYQIHNLAQDLVPAPLRRDFHIFAVIHGRMTCTPRNPKCHLCPLMNGCPFPDHSEECTIDVAGACKSDKQLQTSQANS